VVVRSAHALPCWIGVVVVVVLATPWSIAALSLWSFASFRGVDRTTSNYEQRSYSARKRGLRGWSSSSLPPRAHSPPRLEFSPSPSLEAPMPPWAYQGEFELHLRKGGKGGELLERALAEPRLSYKGVVGALVNALRKAKRKQRCAGACLPALVRLSSELSGTACRCSPCSAHSAPRLPPSGARKTCSVRSQAVHLM